MPPMVAYTTDSPLTAMRGAIRAAPDAVGHLLKALEEELETRGLVMGGGGARAAYQVGFLRYLARRFPDLEVPIVTGASAGAINAAMPSTPLRTTRRNGAFGSRGKLRRTARDRLNAMRAVPMRTPGTMPARKSRPTEVPVMKA